MLGISVPQIWIIVGQGSTVLAGAAVRGCLHIFLSTSFLSLWETARYRLEYFLKEPLNLKQSTSHEEQSDLNFLCWLRTLQKYSRVYKGLSVVKWPKKPLCPNM